MASTSTKLIVTGGSPLHGSVRTSGMKNAALPILFACLLNTETCVIRNLPRVTDIDCSLHILETAGAEIHWIDKDTVSINAAGARYGLSDPSDVQRLRGSLYLMGAELGRFGHSKIARPGGCNFAPRPIDQHKKAFTSMGAVIMEGQDFIWADSQNPKEPLEGGYVSFDIQSVGATANAILAATLAKGYSEIENAAKEPHIVDLANFLNACGAEIRGAGTSTIKIRGVERLHGCTYEIIPDMIEAGTLLVMAAGAGGDVTVTNVIPQHLKTVTAKLIEAGMQIEDLGDALRIRSAGNVAPAVVKAAPYPNFPTDMQPQFAALLSVCNGESVIEDNVFTSRFQYVEALNRMGASIEYDSDHGRALITGVKYLTGAKVTATDLRAAAALVIAALIAKGESEITGIDKLKRGYEDIVEKLSGLGAVIREIPE